MDESLNYSASTFLETINRGGLARPTDYTFMVAVNCWRVFEAIRASSDLKNQLLQATNQKSVFCKTIDRVTVDQLCDPVLVRDNMCVKGHDLKYLLVSRFFNCVAKNLAKDLTNKEQRSSLKVRQSNRRKVAKLTSNSDK